MWLDRSVKRLGFKVFLTRSTLSDHSMRSPPRSATPSRHCWPNTSVRIYRNSPRRTVTRPLST